MRRHWKKRVARLVSIVLSPFLISIVVVILISCKFSASAFDAFKWSAIALTLSILPVFLIIVYLVRKKKLLNIFIDVRRQRHKIYLLAGGWSTVSCVVLYLLEAPLELVAAVVAALVSAVIFMGINFLWKISVHTAFAAGTITMVFLLYGAMGAVAAVLLPIIGWSRIELEHHSPAQVAMGALISALIVVAVFNLFGVGQDISFW